MSESQDIRQSILRLIDELGDMPDTEIIEKCRTTTTNSGADSTPFILSTPRGPNPFYETLYKEIPHSNVVSHNVFSSEIESLIDLHTWKTNLKDSALMLQGKLELPHHPAACKDCRQARRQRSRYRRYVNKRRKSSGNL